MANGHRALEFMNKIEAETGKQISDGLFDALVYLIDDAWSRGNKQGRAEGMESSARIADSNAAVARFWEGQSINYAVAAAIRASIPKERIEG